MKLSQYFTETSAALDDFTLRHLRVWCERHVPSSDEPLMIAARMVAYLESISQADRDYLINEGWTRVFDHMEAAK